MDIIATYLLSCYFTAHQLCVCVLLCVMWLYSSAQIGLLENVYSLITMCVCVHACVHTCTCVCVCVCVCVYVCYLLYCAVAPTEPVLEMSSTEVLVITGSLLVNMSLKVGCYSNITGYLCNSKS